MGRAKTPAWQPMALHAKFDETTGRWLARTHYRDGAEKLVDIKRQGRTKGAAEQAVRTAIKKAEQSWGEDHSSTTLTLTMLAAEWLDVRKPAAVEVDAETQSGGAPVEGQLRMQSWNQYRQKLRDHVIPVLGEVPVAELSTPMCQKALHELYDRDTGRGSRTSSLTKEVLMQVLDYAIQQGYRTDNPVRSVSRIPNRRPKPKSMKPDTVRRVHSAVAQRQVEPGIGGPKPTSRLADVLLLLAATGMRIGEALAVRWQDIDLAATPPIVTVTGTLVEGSSFYRQEVGKSSNSFRAFSITVPWAAAMLLRRSANAVPTATGAVFASRNGTFLRPSNFRSDLRKALSAAGISERITPKSFRTTVATAASAIHGLEAAASTLGHASPETTRRHYIEPAVLTPDITEGLKNLAPTL